MTSNRRRYLSFSDRHVCQLHVRSRRYQSHRDKLEESRRWRDTRPTSSILTNMFRTDATRLQSQRLFAIRREIYQNPASTNTIEVLQTFFVQLSPKVRRDVFLQNRDFRRSSSAFFSSHHRRVRRQFIFQFARRISKQLFRFDDDAVQLLLQHLRDGVSAGARRAENDHFGRVDVLLEEIDQIRQRILRSIDQQCRDASLRKKRNERVDVCLSDRKRNASRCDGVKFNI